jgi:CSLREA domain-containing protein
MTVRRSFTVLAATMLVGSLSLLTAPSALAATFIVTRFDDPAPGSCDPNDCSLREAVLAANASLGISDTIQLAAGTYALSIPGTGEDGALDGDLDVTNDPLTILGQGPGATIIDGGGAAVGEAAFGLFADTTMDGLTIRNSVAPADVAGVFVSGVTYTLRNASITQNSAPGAACCAGLTVNPVSTLNFTNVDITNNTSGTGCCAGIVASGTTFNLTDVRMRGNTSADCCAGIVASGGTFTLTNVDISNNTSESGCCAGFVANPDTLSSMVNTTVSGNRSNGTSASGQDCCAGITSGGPFTLRNVTVSDNVAQDCCAGIVPTGLAWNLNNVTATGNAGEQDNTLDGSTTGSAGVFQFGASTVTIGNTLVSGNIVGGGGAGGDCRGTIGSNGYNLIGSVPAMCTFVPGTGDQVGVSAMLGPLGDHGGFVPTVPLLKGSPAVNGGNPALPGSGGAACEAADARGLARNCDIGAYELTFCRKEAVNRIGTTGNDSLRGTSGRDGMLSFGGKDALRGKGGKDGLCGGPGKDLLKGGAGKDILDGGPGKDLCVGGPGRDKARSCEKRKSIP